MELWKTRTNLRISYNDRVSRELAKPWLSLYSEGIDFSAIFDFM